MRAQPVRRWDRETALLAWLTACVSILSFAFYLRRGDILLYGDAVAHINIARRVFDSRTPGLLQLGTVWLPLPHLLMIPFLFSRWMWQTGAGGSIPSMIAYVFGAVGVFRLVRDAIASTGHTNLAPRVAAWLSAIVFVANPNLLYLQATAMTEALYLALFVWTIVYFTEFIHDVNEADASRAASSLVKCGVCLGAACWTRYDAWFMAIPIGVSILAVVIRRKSKPSSLRSAFAKFVLLAAAGPVLWLAYNAAVYRNPLEFANGPYSAKAVEQRSTATSHPGSHDLRTAFSYFLKAAEINLAGERWQKLWLLLAGAGVLAAAIQRRLLLKVWPLLVLWTPLVFYPLSIAYGGVPIYVPPWWPFSHYNVRYGLELLPAFAVFVALGIYFVSEIFRPLPFKLAMAAGLLLFVSVSYVSIWRNPVCFTEALVNSVGRLAVERELADFVKVFPPDSTILMYLGNHVGALQQAGIPLRRVINEGNHRTWKQPVDLDGLWERALAHPARFAEFVIAFDGDPVSNAIQKDELIPLAVIHTSGEARARIYRTRAPAR
jgi:hypothetical protein